MAIAVVHFNSGCHVMRRYLKTKGKLIYIDGLHDGDDYSIIIYWYCSKLWLNNQTFDNLILTNSFIKHLPPPIKLNPAAVIVFPTSTAFVYISWRTQNFSDLSLYVREQYLKVYINLNSDTAVSSITYNIFFRHSNRGSAQKKLSISWNWLALLWQLSFLTESKQSFKLKSLLRKIH